MSLEKKSIHIRLTPEMHERLKTLANLKNMDIAGMAELFLEKQIVAEFHTLSIELERMEKMGLFGIKRENA